ncbi:MAG: hypothetical protein AAF702_47150 [Chloroflexota bacterium]
MYNRNPPDGPHELEGLLTQSAIDASLFLPFTVFRLRPYSINQKVTLAVSLYELNAKVPKTYNLELFWNRLSDTLTTPPIQAHTVTEWAACGIALALVPIFTPYRVLEVAQVGERFDYWLGHDVRDVGLEISGTIDGDLSSRTKIKQRQLMRNPYKSAGYVCVVGFEKQQVRLSFYQDEV